MDLSADNRTSSRENIFSIWAVLKSPCQSVSNLIRIYLNDFSIKRSCKVMRASETSKETY